MWPPNQLADRAGRYRRVAIGFSLLAVPMTAMGASVIGRPEYQLFALCHLAVAAAFLWVARDLVLWGGLIGPARRPHASLVALLGLLALLWVASPAGFGSRFGSMQWLAAGLALLASAVAILLADELRPNAVNGLVGRSLLVAGGAVLGVAEIIRMGNALGAEPLYALGVGLAGLLLCAMAVFEFRLIRRAVQLAAHQSSCS